MESTPDQKFIDNFTAVLAALVLFTVAIIALSVVWANRTAGAALREDVEYQQRLEDRIRPLGDVVVAGQSTTLLGRSAVDSVAVAAGDFGPVEKAANASFESGQAVYDAACTACHGLGVAGAPKMGDIGQWAPRIASGMETLYSNAIKGYTGSAGVMPPKGGRTDLTDEQVRWSVDYMVENSR